jgi:acetyltransferase-like isoleucine patch superfamily enzyme
MLRHTDNRLPFEDPLIWIPKGLIKLYNIWLSLTYPFAARGSNLSIHYTCRLNRPVARAISLGNSICIGKDSWLNVSGPAVAGVDPAIVIDDGTFIGPRCQISATNRIHIERDVLISDSVLIMDHNHAYEDITMPILRQGITPGGRIRIGQGSWIGRGAAIICPKGELTIGRNCVIAVNAMVTGSIPDYSVVFGAPATVIRQYDPETRAWRIGPNEGRGTRNRESAVQFNSVT